MKVHTKSRDCDGKFPHPSRKAALAHRAALIHGGASPAALHAYRCPHCKTFHVGHRPRGRR